MQCNSERSSLSKLWLSKYLCLLRFRMLNKNPQYSQLLPRITGFCILIHVSVTLECLLPWMMTFLGSWQFVATTQRCHRKLRLLPSSSSLVSPVDWTHQGAREPGKCPRWCSAEQGKKLVWDQTGTYTMNNGDAPLSTGKHTTLKNKTFKFGATSIIYETKKHEQVNSPSPDSGFLKIRDRYVINLSGL